MNYEGRELKQCEQPPVLRRQLLISQAKHDWIKQNTKAKNPAEITKLKTHFSLSLINNTDIEKCWNFYYYDSFLESTDSNELFEEKNVLVSSVDRIFTDQIQLVTVYRVKRGHDIWSIACSHKFLQTTHL